MLVEYLMKYHRRDLTQILDAPDDSLHYSINVNFVSLFEADSQTANKILRRPRYYLTLCDRAVIEAQENLVTESNSVKRKVRVRITAVPVRINQGQIGELVSTTGITVQVSQPAVQQQIRRYHCRKCKHVTVVELEWERLIFPETKECEACRSRSITAVTALQHEDCVDYQEIKIQEKFQTDTNNSYAISIQVVLLDDLVDKCRPGDHIDICGTIIRRWGPIASGRRPEITTIMLANSISVRRKTTETEFSSQETKRIFEKYWQSYKGNPLVGRDNILASICSQIYGLYTVKLALAVVLAGGVSKTNESGTRVRGEPHLLLIGDPGTGKSQLLRTAARLAVRSVLTTGIGTTAAGLTAAAVKDGDGWHLEGGALVLADGGVCCVDEFTTMTSNDRASVHEAMEQQTVSVAKAGLVSTLNSRCSVIAATNPAGGRFVDGEELNTSLGNPLLSRFDLILILKDNNNPEWDQMISDHILEMACGSNDRKSKISGKKPMDLLESEGLWKEESLREYLAFVHTLKPTLNRDAKKILNALYLYQRSNPERRAERTTVRLLDSLIRLAEGHARLMYRTEVTVIDAIVAGKLIGVIDTSTGAGCPFPVNPMDSYYTEGAEILRKLNLEHMSASL